MSSDKQTSIDEQLREFMVGWFDGVRLRDDTHASCDEPYHRGIDAGQDSRRAAERAERERLERCPACKGTGALPLPPGAMADLEWNRCDDCHGTGKRS